MLRPMTAEDISTIFLPPGHDLYIYIDSKTWQPYSKHRALYAPSPNYLGNNYMTAVTVDVNYRIAETIAEDFNLAVW